MADDLVNLVQDQENVRRVASSYSGFTDQPGLAVALARSGASAAQIRAVGGFMKGLQLSTKVALARQSGVQLDLTNDDRATLAAVDTPFSDVDKQQIAAQAAPAEQHRGFFGTIAHIANDATQLPGIKQTFHFLDRAADVTNTLYREGSMSGFLPGANQGNSQAAAADVGERTRDMIAQGYNPESIVSTLAFASRGSKNYHNMDDLRKQFSPDQVSLAQQYLQDPEGFVSPNLSDDELLKRQKALQDEHFQTIVSQVDARHSSPGRDVVSGVLTPGTKPYTITSGAIDATWSFFADPTLVLGKAHAASKVARFGISDLNDTGRVRDLMEHNSSVKRGWMSLLDSAKTMRSGDDAEAGAAYARVNALTPELTPLLDEINGGGSRAGKVIDNYDDLVNHVVGTGALVRLRNGLAAQESPLMPGALPRLGFRQVRASLASRASIDLNKKAGDFISNSGDGVNGLGADATGLDSAVSASANSAAVGQAALSYRRSIKGRAATLFTRMTTLLPEHSAIDLTSASGAEDVRRFAAMYMPRAHANTLAARFATGSVGDRRAIAEGVYDQVMHAAGVPASTSGRAWLEAQKVRRAQLDNSAYDASGKDRDRIAGANGEPERRAALYDGQTSTDYWLPNPAELRRFAAKVSIYDFTMKSALESKFVDTALGALRTSWLLSPASAIRNGIENVVSAHFRGASSDEVARSRAALSSVLSKRVADRATDLASQQVDGDYHKMSGSLRGVYHGRILSGMKKAESAVGAKVANADLVKRAEELVDDDMSGDLHELLALTGLATRGDARNVDDIVSGLDKGFKLNAVGFKNAGYQLDSADGMGGARYWAQQLATRFKGTEGQHVLKAAVDGTPESKQALVDHLLSPEYEGARARLERFHTLRDGTAVGDDPALTQRAAEELAADQIDDMHALVHGRNGEVIQPLVDELTKTGMAPKAGFLSDIKDEQRPENVIQPKFVVDLDGGSGNIASNVVQALGDSAYHVAVARPLAWMSSLPIYHANYAKAYARVESFMKSSHPDWEADEIAAHTRDVARQHAMDLTVQMIDNPRVRSQMALITRNVFNFWRAQEDFMRRWGRNLHENPAALRELQLAVEGGMHTGLVHKDDQGQLVFSYPGSGLAIQGLGKALGVFGLEKFVGLGTVPNMTTKLQFLNAGLDRPFLPTTSPVASVPLRLLKHFAGDQVQLIQAQEITEGTIGTSRSWYAQFLPSPVYRFMQAQSSDEQEGQAASAARNAALNLYAAGLAPPPNATPDEVDAFKKRIQVGVRNQLTARAVLALFLPGAPSSPTEETDASKAGGLEAKAYNTVSLKQEFSQWVNQYGYQRALSLWTKSHPDDLAYTVGTTQGAGGTGGNLAPTDEVMQWMQDNPDLVGNYPGLAAYFAPDGPGDFSQDAWQTELELGLRQHKDLGSFYRDVAVKGAETTYYNSRDRKNQAVAEATAAGNDDQAKQIKAAFNDWLDTYKKANPLLTEKWNESSENKTRIAQLVTEVGKLAGSPLASQLDPHGDLQRIAQAYTAKQQYDDTHNATTADARAQKDSVQTAYMQYVAGVLSRSPNLIPVYQGVFDRVE